MNEIKNLSSNLTDEPVLAYSVRKGGRKYEILKKAARDNAVEVIIRRVDGKEKSKIYNNEDLDKAPDVVAEMLKLFKKPEQKSGKAAPAAADELL